MKIDSAFVGTPLREYKMTVDRRGTMNYAAAVDDANSVYFDDDSGKTVVAPPMYAVAVTWPVSERIWEFIDSEDFPKDLIRTQVHYTEHLYFHRPIRPGDTLTVKGKIASITPHRAGAVIVIRFDAEDDGGNVVFTEHIGGMLRGVECVDSGKGTENIPKIQPAPDNTMLHWESAIKIDRMRPFIYDGCTDIIFPIHTSIGFAHAVGLPDIILQGTATLAYAAREITDREGNGDPALLRVVSCRFTDMVIPGGSIRVQLTGKVAGTEGTDLYFQVLNDQARRVLSNGYARLERH